MASTVLIFEWQAMFLKAQIPLCSPHFGNEKMRFRFCATSYELTRAKFWLQVCASSTVNEIVANVEYRTSKVNGFSGEFTSLKKIVLKKDSWVELFQADLEDKEKLCFLTQCDGHFVNIEVKITIFDEEPSFLVTWNSFGSNKASFLDIWNSSGSNKAVNHADIFCQNLAVFGAESSFADVIVCTVADGKEFKVHSTILAMRSPVFAAMFAEGNFKESQEKKVYIEDFDGQVIGAFIDYLYGRKNTEWKLLAGDLAKVADKYDVKSLFTACSISLVADVNVENAAKNFSCAYQFGMSAKMSEIAQFIVKNKAAVMATDGWKECFQSNFKLYDALFLII